MTTDGAHPHPSLATKAALDALAARVSALEAQQPPASPWKPIWPVTEAPAPMVQVRILSGQVDRLIGACRDGGYNISVESGADFRGGADLLIDGPHTILSADGAGMVWRGGGVYARTHHVVVDNLEPADLPFPNLPAGQLYDDGARAEGPGADQVMFSRISIADAADECLDFWTSAPSAKRVVVTRAKLGYGPRRIDNKPYAFIIGTDAGGDGRLFQVGLFDSVLSGGFRNPLVNGNSGTAQMGPYLYQDLCVIPSWGLCGASVIMGGRAFIDRSWYGAGDRPSFAHIPDAGTGGTAWDRTAAIRNGGGNHYDVAPNPYDWQSALVAAPTTAQRWRPGATMNAAERDRIIARAGRGTPA